MVETRKAIFIHSPGSGRSDELDNALNMLQEAGIEIVEKAAIDELDDKDRLAQHWIEAGATITIAAGGDGLVSGVTGMIAGHELALGIMPLGTANDVARSIDMPLDLKEAAEVIAHGPVRQLDLGVMLPVEATSSLASDELLKQGKLFAHALTMGFHAHFSTLATDKELREQFGKLTYPVAIMEAVKNYQPTEIELRFDGLLIRERPDAQPKQMEQSVTLRCKAAQVTIANANVFWGALEATLPGENSLRDGMLDVVVMEDARLDQLLVRITRFFSRTEHTFVDHDDEWHARYPELLRAELTDIPGMHHLKARGVQVRTRDGSYDVALDGEVCAKTPLGVRVLPRALPVIVPEQKREQA